MTKLSRRQLDSKEMGFYINSLWSVFTLMDSKEDVRLLFKDLFTHTEYKMFAKRLEIARRLLRNISYAEIQDDLKVTPNTITKISNILAEKGEGLRKADSKMTALDQKHRALRLARQKNLEHPYGAFRNRRTVLGAAAKVGLAYLDKKISKKIKDRTAGRSLPA